MKQEADSRDAWAFADQRSCANRILFRLKFAGEIFRQVPREVPSRFQRVVLKNRNQTPDYRARQNEEMKREREDARCASLDISHGEIIRRWGSKKPREINRKIRYRPIRTVCQLGSHLAPSPIFLIRCSGIKRGASMQSVDADLMICGMRLVDSNDRETCVH